MPFNDPVGQPDSTRVESVSGLNKRIKALLEGEIQPLWIRGEVSNLRQQSSGHVYFSLKDAVSQISCVMFRGDAARSTIAWRDGAQLIVFGSISVYEPRGSYQLVVRMALEDGVGRLQQEFERLKARLAAEGLFAAERKRPLPAAPRTVGFITSPTGAAVQDFVRILKRRGWLGRIIVIPAKVQGAGAADDLVDGLQLAENLGIFDLLVIGRGGGSLEDLWAFNEEAVVRAVAACPIPVISAVGHEIDFSLCDFAADWRAETPSAAAERISSEFVSLVERTRQAEESLDDALKAQMRGWRDALEIVRGRLGGVSPQARIEFGWLRVDELCGRLLSELRACLQTRRDEVSAFRERFGRFHPESHLKQARQAAGGMRGRFERCAEVAWQGKLVRLRQAGLRLEALGPEATLKRGYAIIETAEGRTVMRQAELKQGEPVQARFADGRVKLRVE
jgi:exodeoxyribonuclease VII large subunit